MLLPAGCHNRHVTDDPRSPGFQPVQTLPEEPSRSPWLLAIAALVLVALGGVVLGAFFLGGAPAPSPSPTAVGQASPTTPTASPAAPTARPSEAPSPSPAGSPDSTASPSPAGSPAPSPSGSPAGPSPDGSPGATAPPDIAAAIDAVVAQVPPIRDLEPLRDVPYEMVTREQFQADLQVLLEEELDPEVLAAEERVLKRLGLLPDDLDLQSLLLELYGAGVAAYYQPANGTFYVIERDAPFGPLDRMYVAHEYTHALQDQHYDLEGTRMTDQSQGDAVLAQLAAVEGDASWLMVLWAQQHLTFEELFEILTESLAPADAELLEGMPPILVRQLTFTYNEGLTFVSGIQQEDGWEAVNQIFAEPPASTEQVLHPEKYFAGEAPVTVDIPDLAGALGGGWVRTYEQIFGELNVQILATADEEAPEAVPGMPVTYPFAEVAAGWGGDRLHMYEDGGDGWAIVWELEWDSPADADEFVARIEELQETLDGESDIVEVGPQTVRLLLANDTVTLTTLTAALED